MLTHLGLSLRGANRGGFFLTASPDSSGKDSEDTIPTEGGDIPPLQGGKRMTGKTQGVALGYRILPRWGPNSRACVGGQACVGGGSGVRGLVWDVLVCNGPNGARGDSPGQGPGVIRRIMGALKGRNGVCPVGRCEPWGIAGACGARAAGSEIRPYLKGALWRRGRIGEGGIPPLQGGNRMAERTQGVALGCSIRPRWGRNCRGVRRGAARSDGPSANPWIPGAVSGWIGAT